MRIRTASAISAMSAHVIAGVSLCWAAGAMAVPAAESPFTDFRDEAPGNVHKITLQDLPAPYATPSAGNSPTLVPRPPGVLPSAPPGFKVNLFAENLRIPRALRVAPNGDVFVAETGAAQIRIFRGVGADGKPQLTSVYVTGLNRPYGMAFYPPGPNPRWLYVGNTDAVVRIPYHNGALEADGGAGRVVDLPNGGGHWTRDIAFSPDGRTMFVAVGSGSNVDDPDRKSRGNSSRRHSGLRSRRREPARLRVRHSQSIRHSRRSENRQALDDRERARWAGRQPGTRLRHVGARRRLLRLAVVVHGAPSGPPPRGEAPGAGGAGDHSGRDPAAAQRVTANHVL